MKKRRDLFFYKGNLGFLILFFISVSLGISGPLYAQDDEDEFTLEEITVTAEKRESTLQKIPLAIDVVRPDDMNIKGVFDTQDLGKILPDLQINMSAANYMQINLRDVPDLIFNPEFETTVSMHVDGVQVTRNQGFNNYFYDLQRVEVLKGPVGTLYGRGSTAGAINVITQKPILNEFGGNLSLEIGNYNERRYMGAVNIPIADKIAIRLAGRIYKHDGYTDIGYNDANGYGARMGVTWEPTDKDTITATVDFEGYDNEGSGSTGVYLDTFGNLEIEANPNGTTIPQTWSHAIVIPYKIAWYTGDDYLKTGGSTHYAYTTARPRENDNFNDDDSWGVTLQWEREIDLGYLTTLYGHRSLHELKDWCYYSAYLGYGTMNEDGIYETMMLKFYDYGMYIGNGTTSHTNSLETHMSSKTSVNDGDRLEWIVGGIIQDDEIIKYSDPSYNVYWEDLTTETRALFGQATAKIIGNLNFTGGYRHSWDTKKYYGTTYGRFGLIDFDSTTYPRHHEKYSWSEDTYKAGLNYQLTDSTMIYGGYSKGYKTGNVQNDGSMLPPEYLDAWEIGIKSRFLNDRLQVNVSTYYYDYKNFNQWSTAYKCSNYIIYESVGSTTQVGIYTPGADQGPDATIQNVDASTDSGLALLHTCSGVEDPDNPGSYLSVTNDDYDEYISVAVAPGGAEQKGVSGSIMYLLTHKDTINLTARWSNNKYKNYNLASALLARLPLADNVYSDPSTYGDQSGVEFGAPPVRGNVSFTHSEYFGTDTVTFNTTAYYQGKGVDERVYNSRDGFWFMPGVDDYWLMDASITYRTTRWVPEGMSWQLCLWSTNIFNSQYLYSISYASKPSYDVKSGTISGSFVAPRTYGVTLSFDF